MIINVSGIEGFTGNVYNDLQNRFPESGRVSIDSRYDGVVAQGSPNLFSVEFIVAPSGLRHHHVNGILHQHSLRAPSIVETVQFLLEFADNRELMIGIFKEETILFFHEPVRAFGGHSIANHLHRYASDIPFYATSICHKKVLEEIRISLFNTCGGIEIPTMSNTPYLLAGVRM